MSKANESLEQGVTGQLGRVIKSMETGVKGLSTAVEQTVEQIEGNLQKIEAQEAMIAGKTEALESLDTSFGEKKRQLQAELNVWETEARLATATTIANASGMIMVKNDEWQTQAEAVEKMDETIAAMQKKFSAEKQAAIGAALKTKELEHAASNAEQAAQLKSLKTELETSRATITDLKDQITKEREARVEVEKSRSQPVVNVSGK